MCQRGRGSCSHVSKLLLPGHVTFRPLFIQTRPEVRGQTDAAGSAASELWSRAGSVGTQSPPSVGLMICHPVASMNMSLRLLVIWNQLFLLLVDWLPRNGYYEKIILQTSQLLCLIWIYWVFSTWKCFFHLVDPEPVHSRVPPRTCLQRSNPLCTHDCF